MGRKGRKIDGRKIGLRTGSALTEILVKEIQIRRVPEILTQRHERRGDAREAKKVSSHG
jgi:hypothetical protein